MSTYKGNCSIFKATIQLTAVLILKMKVKLSLAYGLSTSLNQKRKEIQTKEIEKNHAESRKLFYT